MHRLVNKLAIALLAALTFVFAPAPALAASPTGTITVNCSEVATVSAWQVVAIDARTGDWVLTGWAATALGEDATAALTALTSSDSDATTRAGYLATLANAARAESGPTADATATTAEAESGSGTFSAVLKDASGSLAMGAYLVLCTSASGKYVYSNMFKGNYDADTGTLADVTLTAKGSAAVSVTKTYETESTDAPDGIEMDERQQFTVTFTFPDFSSTAEPKLVLTDDSDGTLIWVQASQGSPVAAKNGLSLAEAGTVSASISDVDFSANNLFTEAASLSNDGNGKFTIEFKEDWLKENASAIAGKTFSFTYWAKAVLLNTSAEAVAAGEAENALTNTATVTYNVDGGADRTASAKETVYTVTLVVDKYKNTPVEANRLPGAILELRQNRHYLLFQKESDGVYRLLGETVCQDSTPEQEPYLHPGTEYRTAGEMNYTVNLDESNGAAIITNRLECNSKDGTLTLKGLGPNQVYTLYELKAPDLYERIPDETMALSRIKFTGSNGAYSSLAYYKSGKKKNKASEEILTYKNATPSSEPRVYLLNSRLPALPETGGSGVAAATLAGAALLAASGSGAMLLRAAGRSSCTRLRPRARRAVRP